MEKKFEKKFFEDWATDYDQRRNKSFLEKSKIHMQKLFDEYLHGDCFLEIGLGTGESFGMVKGKFDYAYGMDISEGMVRKTHVKLHKNLNLFVGDGCNLALKSNSFDFIVCQDVLEHVPSQEKLIREICRILKPEGIAIITTPNPIWSPALYIAEKLKWKVEEGEHKFVFLESLVKKTIIKLNCLLLDSSPFMMFPVRTKLDGVLESLSKQHVWSKLGFSQMCIIKKQFY